jgi:hypothetical protein
MVNLNAYLDKLTATIVEQLLQEYKNVFVWTYKDLKGIPSHIVQHQIELNTIMPLVHQIK